ncbi:GFA family protein [Candidatus Kaiserbacteria bacterium]|nr:GFA family protein [Candidatus Kaiserbacteria bacterium]
MKIYTGGCHCGAVRYEVEASMEKIIHCNCSHCEKKGLYLDFVDKEKFKLLSGASNLTEYKFNKKAIRHLFCKTCGVQSYGEGVTFPKVAINVRCLDSIDISKLNLMPYNGKDL